MFFVPLDVESVDFARSQEAADIINSWCANATKNHIRDIVNPGLWSDITIWGINMTVQLLISTILFCKQMTLHAR